MKKVGFIGAYDKANFIIYIAKILEILNYKVLVVDASIIQKIRYIIPSINPTRSYITSFENIDFAVGFESWEEIEKYLGMIFDTNEDDGNEEAHDIKEFKEPYDYILIDVDSFEKIEKFEVESIEKKYFVTSFDMYSLKKGLSIFDDLKKPMNLTKILFSYEANREDEIYLNNISLESKIDWNEYTIYFQILGEDNKVFEENQRFEKIKFRRLSLNYKESLAYVVQDINKKENMGKIKKAMKD